MCQLRNASLFLGRRSWCRFTAFSRRASTVSSKKVSDPLRILFCGSDEFSCASLEALQAEKERNRELIRSIDVVVRPPKPTGRGNKVIRRGMMSVFLCVLSLFMCLQGHV